MTRSCGQRGRGTHIDRVPSLMWAISRSMRSLTNSLVSRICRQGSRRPERLRNTPKVTWLGGTGVRAAAGNGQEPPSGALSAGTVPAPPFGL